MNIPVHILEFLKVHHKAEISGFGTFSLKNTTAAISEDGKILPPAKQIAFSPDFEIRNSAFIHYISQTEKVSEFEVELELKKTTNHWKNKLEADQKVEIPEIGTIWNNENGLQFKGERMEDSSPDFYGLEEISLAEIKRSKNSDIAPVESIHEKDDYTFNKSILWIFLIAIPVLGLLFFGITRRELLFGKKSFDEVSIKTSTKRIPKNSVQVDSAKIKLQDSLKNDSLKNATVPAKNSPTKKKWNSKNYSKSKKWK